MSEHVAAIPILVQNVTSEYLFSSNATTTLLTSDFLNVNIKPLILAAIVAVVVSSIWSVASVRYSNLPEGPWGYPILGRPCFMTAGQLTEFTDHIKVLFQC